MTFSGITENKVEELSQNRIRVSSGSKHCIYNTVKLLFTRHPWARDKWLFHRGSVYTYFTYSIFMDSGKNSYLHVIRRLLNKSLTVVYCSPCRISDALFHAMLLWYYSTLTLQEHILIANGSRYKSLLSFVYIHIR